MQTRKSAYNVILGRVRVTTVTVEKQFLFFFLLDGTTVHCGPSSPSWNFPVSSVFDLSLQVLILYLVIFVCTQFHRPFVGRPLRRLPLRLLLKTLITFLLLSILLT